MNYRVRSVLIGVFAGLAPLLLLDLAQVLQDAIFTDPGGTSRWWPVACYVGAGTIVAFGVSAARGDRLVAIVGMGVLLIAALPSVVSSPAWLPDVPLVTRTFASQAVAFAAVGAYGYALARGSRA